MRGREIRPENLLPIERQRFPRSIDKVLTVRYSTGEDGGRTIQGWVFKFTTWVGNSCVLFSNWHVMSLDDERTLLS